MLFRSVALDGAPFVQGNPRVAREQGIAIIYQEPSLFPDLTLAENVYVGRQPLRGRRVDWALMRQQVGELFTGLGIHLDPQRLARGLSIADQQMVEIVKALSTDARIIIMDEPSAGAAGTCPEETSKRSTSWKPETASSFPSGEKSSDVITGCRV